MDVKREIIDVIGNCIIVETTYDGKRKYKAVYKKIEEIKNE